MRERCTDSASDGIVQDRIRTQIEPIMQSLYGHGRSDHTDLSRRIHRAVIERIPSIGQAVARYAVAIAVHVGHQPLPAAAHPRQGRAITRVFEAVGLGAQDQAIGHAAVLPALIENILPAPGVLRIQACQQLVVGFFGVVGWVVFGPGAGDQREQDANGYRAVHGAQG